MLGHAFGNARTRRQVGFLAENVSLFQRPADSLVRFYGALNGMSGKHLAKRSIEVLSEVGLGAEAKRNVKGFSRGMLQRVGLAQAIVNDPELLILDEPTSALDPRARVIVRELLLDFRNRGKTIFLSSHLLSEVEVVCDRVAVLNQGKLVRLGTTGAFSNQATSRRSLPVEFLLRCWLARRQPTAWLASRFRLKDYGRPLNRSGKPAAKSLASIL